MTRVVQVVIVSILVCLLNSSALCQDKTGIQEFSLERTECFGPCPVYRATIRSDGTVTYVGIKNVPRLGIYTGNANPYVIKHLSELVGQINFFSLENEYSSEMTDQPTAVTSVLRGGERKTVRNYGLSGPSLLWAFESSMDAAIASVTDWVKKQPKKNSGRSAKGRRPS